MLSLYHGLHNEEENCRSSVTLSNEGNTYKLTANEAGFSQRIVSININGELSVHLFECIYKLMS